MRTSTMWRRAGLLLGALAMAAPTAVATAATPATHTETLGPLGLDLAGGTGLVTAGVGLEHGGPGTIEYTLDEGETVQQALLYWSGYFTETSSEHGDDTVTVDGIEVMGQLVGGPAMAYRSGGPAGPLVHVSTYRAVLEPAAFAFDGSLEIDGLDNDRADNGAGLVLVTDDGGPAAHLDGREGVDLTYARHEEPRRSTVPQTFTFEPAELPRMADLTLMAASVGVDRPSRIDITVADETTTLWNVLTSSDGDSWDTFRTTVLLPPGVEALTVAVQSAFDESPNNPTSAAWNTAFLDVPAPRPSILFSCRASAARSHGGILGDHDLTVANAAEDPCLPGHEQSLEIPQAGLFLSAASADTSDADADGPMGKADVSILNAVLDLPGGSFLHATGLSSHAQARCVDGAPVLSGSSELVVSHADLGGLQVVSPGLVTAYQKVVVPGLATIELNRQTIEDLGAGRMRLLQQAVRIDLRESIGGVIVIGETIAGHDGGACP